MELTVEPGRTYAVTTSGSCTVTDADGLMLCTASAGAQAYFVATSGTVTVSDVSAKVVKANFSCALAGSTAGGGDKLPDGYTRAEFLESDGTQYIDTGLTGCDSTSFVEFSGVAKGYGKRAFQGGAYCLCSRRPDYRDFYVTMPCANNVEKKSGYLPETLSQPYHIDAIIRTEKITVNGKTYSIDEMPNAPASTINNSSLNLGAYPGGALYQSSWWVGTCERFRAKLASGQVNLIPVINAEGEACFYDTVSGSDFKNSGQGRYIAGLKDISALKNVLINLPSRTAAGSILDVSLPEGVDDNEVRRICDLAGTFLNWQITSI